MFKVEETCSEKCPCTTTDERRRTKNVIQFHMNRTPRVVFEKSNQEKWSWECYKFFFFRAMRIECSWFINWEYVYIMELTQIQLCILFTTNLNILYLNNIIISNMAGRFYKRYNTTIHSFMFKIWRNNMSINTRIYEIRHIMITLAKLWYFCLNQNTTILYNVA